MVKKIDTKEFETMDKSGVCVVDFNATWCGPCRMLAPILESLSEDYEGKAKFFAIDTDENQELSEKFNIMSIPAVIILKDGVKVDASIGLVQKQNLAAVIDKALA